MSSFENYMEEENDGLADLEREWAEATSPTADEDDLEAMLAATLAGDGASPTTELEDMLAGTSEESAPAAKEPAEVGPAADAEPASVAEEPAEVGPAAEAEQQAADEAAGAPEPLTSKSVQKGMRVQMVSDARMRGAVVKKAGKNAQVDFSESGGDPAKWTPCTELAAESEPEGGAPAEPEEQLTPLQQVHRWLADHGRGAVAADVCASMQAVGIAEDEWVGELEAMDADGDLDEFINANQRAKDAKEEEAEAFLAAQQPDKVYELKQKRNKVKVQLSPMALVVTQGKKPPTTYLYQTLDSWGTNSKGLEIVLADSERVPFTCSTEDAEEICAAISEKAQELAKAAKAKRKAEKRAKKAAKAEAEAAAKAEAAKAAEAAEPAPEDGASPTGDLERMLAEEEGEAPAPETASPAQKFEEAARELEEMRQKLEDEAAAQEEPAEETEPAPEPEPEQAPEPEPEPQPAADPFADLEAGLGLTGAEIAAKQRGPSELEEQPEASKPKLKPEPEPEPDETDGADDADRPASPQFSEADDTSEASQDEAPGIAPVGAAPAASVTNDGPGEDTSAATAGEFVEDDEDDAVPPAEAAESTTIEAKMQTAASVFSKIAEMQCQYWLESVLSCRLDGTLDVSLRSGTVLCDLANALKPGTIANIDRRAAGAHTGEHRQAAIAASQRENIASFIDSLPTLGITGSSFETVDLYEGREMERVLQTIVRLAEEFGGTQSLEDEDLPVPTLPDEEATRKRMEEGRALSPSVVDQSPSRAQISDGAVGKLAERLEAGAAERIEVTTGVRKRTAAELAKAVEREEESAVARQRAEEDAAAAVAAAEIALAQVAATEEAAAAAKLEQERAVAAAQEATSEVIAEKMASAAAFTAEKEEMQAQIEQLKAAAAAAESRAVAAETALRTEQLQSAELQAELSKQQVQMASEAAAHGVALQDNAQQAQQANAARETELKSELAKERVAKAALEVKVGDLQDRRDSLEQIVKKCQGMLGHFREELRWLSNEKAAVVKEAQETVQAERAKAKAELAKVRARCKDGKDGKD